MVVKMNLSIITKNHAANPEKGSLKKSILKPYDRAAAMPTAWKLMSRIFNVSLIIKSTYESADLSDTPGKSKRSASSIRSE